MEGDRQQETGPSSGLKTTDIDGGAEHAGKDGFSRADLLKRGVAVIGALAAPGAFVGGATVTHKGDEPTLDKVSAAEALSLQAEKLSTDIYIGNIREKLKGLDGAVNAICGVGLNTILQERIFAQLRENSSVLLEWFMKKPVNSAEQQTSQYNTPTQVMQNVLAFIKERNAQEGEEVQADVLQVYLLAYIFASTDLTQGMQAQITPTGSIPTNPSIDPPWLDILLSSAKTYADAVALVPSLADSELKSIVDQVLSYASGRTQGTSISREEGREILLELLQQAAGEK